MKPSPFLPPLFLRLPSNPSNLLVRKRLPFWPLSFFFRKGALFQGLALIGHQPSRRILLPLRTFFQPCSQSRLAGPGLSQSVFSPPLPLLALPQHVQLPGGASSSFTEGQLFLSVGDLFPPPPPPPSSRAWRMKTYRLLVVREAWRGWLQSTPYPLVSFALSHQAAHGEDDEVCGEKNGTLSCQPFFFLSHCWAWDGLYRV